MVPTTLSYDLSHCFLMLALQIFATKDVVKVFHHFFVYENYLMLCSCGSSFNFLRSKVLHLI